MKCAFRSKAVTTLCLSAGFLLPLLGCSEDKVGETVPAPPRDLAEKSMRVGKAPIAPQPDAGSNAAPSGTK